MRVTVSSSKFVMLTLKSLTGAACPLLLWHAGEFEGFSWFGGEDEKQLVKKGGRI